jgi:hypothetical protein
MSTETERVVMYDSPEAASYRTDIKGWVSRNGRYFGEDENMARYDGCTHRPCKQCGKPAPKPYTVCDECRRRSKIGRYKIRERKEWNEDCPVYSEALDRFFDTWDEIHDAAAENGMEVEDLRLLICEPVFAEEIDPRKYYYDLLPEGSPVPAEIEEVFERLNAAIRDCKVPLCWEPGMLAVK